MTLHIEIRESQYIIIFNIINRNDMMNIEEHSEEHSKKKKKNNLLRKVRSNREGLVEVKNVSVHSLSGWVE